MNMSRRQQDYQPHRAYPSTDRLQSPPSSQRRAAIPLSASQQTAGADQSYQPPSSRASHSSGQSFFQSSRNVEVSRSNFHATRGHHTNLTINVNHGEAGYVSDGQDPASHTRDRLTGWDRRPSPFVDEEAEALTPNAVSLQEPQRSCEIYARLLIPKHRGFPLWIPEPHRNLPTAYRRTGVKIGDVGIITSSGSFSFLFNIFTAMEDPIHISRLPAGFIPTAPLRREIDICIFSEFGPGSYLASSTIEKSECDSSPGLAFKTSASEGAVLAMPEGATSINVENIGQIRKYVAAHLVNWYHYVNGPLGRDAKNGDIRIVIGCDKTTSYGMATVTMTNMTQEISHQLKLKPLQISDAPISTYVWEHSGLAEVRAGPDPQEIEEMRDQDPLAPEVGKYKNNCLFLRTINPMLGEEQWLKLCQQLDTPHLVDSCHRTPTSYTQSTSSSRSNRASGNGRFSHRRSDSGRRSSSRRTLHPSQPMFDPPTTMSFHPSLSINKALFEKVSNAEIVITKDSDWFSIFDENHGIILDDDELFKRILANHQILVDNGVVFLEQHKVNSELSSQAPSKLHQANVIGGASAFETCTDAPVTLTMAKAAGAMSTVSSTTPTMASSLDVVKLPPPTIPAPPTATTALSTLVDITPSQILHRTPSLGGSPFNIGRSASSRSESVSVSAGGDPSITKKRRSRSRSRPRTSKYFKGKARATQSPILQLDGDSSQDENSYIPSPIMLRMVPPLASPMPHFPFFQQPYFPPPPTSISRDMSLFYSGTSPPTPLPTSEDLRNFSLMRSNSTGSSAAGRRLAMHKLTGSTETYDSSLSPTPPSHAKLSRNNTVSGGERIAARQNLLNRLGTRLKEGDVEATSGAEDRSALSPTPKRRRRRSRCTSDPVNPVPVISGSEFNSTNPNIILYAPASPFSAARPHVSGYGSVSPQFFPTRLSTASRIHSVGDRSTVAGEFPEFEGSSPKRLHRLAVMQRELVQTSGASAQQYPTTPTIQQQYPRGNTFNTSKPPSRQQSTYQPAGGGEAERMAEVQRQLQLLQLHQQAKERERDVMSSVTGSSKVAAKPSSNANSSPNSKSVSNTNANAKANKIDDVSGGGGEVAKSFDEELAAKIEKSLADPLLPRKKLRVVLQTESELETDTNHDGSWSSEDMSREEVVVQEQLHHQHL
ncbi:unnamed protein product [Cyclocybe aegerita]|uniref:Uncharacterized protein n=1 Tax=Cyclocybe aegerita TaxID=1973307 RepID=A0A8S0VYA2_CYCAE|nr:unnamed protein product [Cyclocybe aegerita]